MSRVYLDRSNQTDCQLRMLLLIVDNSNSVLAECVEGDVAFSKYTAYGARSCGLALGHAGFNGELRERNFGWYLLGNGYRAYSPKLMRFHSPDSWSPFGSGGLNAYIYCSGDPLNRKDTTGHFSLSISAANKALAWLSRARRNLGLSQKVSSMGMPNQVKSSPRTEAMASKYHLAGFHGTSSKHADSLAKGLNEDFSGRETGQSHGAGFYATKNYNYAKTMANLTVSNSPLAAGVNETPTVYGVYVKDYPSQRHTTAQEPFFEIGHYGSTVLIPLPFYRQTLVRRIRSSKPVPESEINQIRQ